MFLDPAQITISEIQLLSQMAQLQRMGTVSSDMDFVQLHGATLEQGYRRMMELTSGRVAPDWNKQPLSVEKFRSGVAEFLQGSLAFRPRADPFFAPQQVLMRRGAEFVPMVIEKTDIAGARDVVPRQYHGELDDLALLEKAEMEISAFLMRSWDGQAHAMAVGGLTVYQDRTQMFCAWDVKFDRRRSSGIRRVGPVMLIARLLYMYRRGFWSDDAPVLNDIRPKILAYYRSQFPEPTNSKIILEEWGINGREGRHFLHHSSFNLAPIPAAISETTRDRSGRS